MIARILSLCTHSLLCQLVTVNNPDKIIFVGEALVGNEAVDQLTKFNRSLRDFSGVSNARGIDGMILTKCVPFLSFCYSSEADTARARRRFDTIDDKVRPVFASLSLSLRLC